MKGNVKNSSTLEAPCIFFKVFLPDPSSLFLACTTLFLRSFTLFFVAFHNFSAFAEEESVTPHRLVLEYAHADLNNNIGVWNDLSFYSYFGVGKSPDPNSTEEQLPQDQIVVGTSLVNHFEESAAVFSATYSHNYNLDWYQDLSGEFSTNNFIMPGYSAFSILHRKLLSDRRLIVGAGAGYFSSQSPYNDLNFLLNFNYYLANGISLEVGFRLNRSNPGSVYTERVYGVVSYILTQKIEAYLRYDTGQEGYTVIGADNFKNEFSSREEAAQVLYWWNRRYGAGINASFYQSQYYNRSGASLIFLMSY